MQMLEDIIQCCAHLMCFETIILATSLTVTGEAAVTTEALAEVDAELDGVANRAGPFSGGESAEAMSESGGGEDGGKGGGMEEMVG